MHELIIKQPHKITTLKVHNDFSGNIQIVTQNLNSKNLLGTKEQSIDIAKLFNFLADKLLIKRQLCVISVIFKQRSTEILQLGQIKRPDYSYIAKEAVITTEKDLEEEISKLSSYVCSELNIPDSNILQVGITKITPEAIKATIKL